MIILSLLILTSGIIFMYMTHPMSMGLIIISHTMIICMIIGMYSLNFWYSYILFLVFLGGLLVLFIYIASLAQNEMFLFKKNWLMKMSYIFLWNVLMYFILLKEIKMNYMNIDSYLKEKFLNQNLYLMTIQFFSPIISKTTMFLGLYLLLCLMIITKICQLNKGPIRQKF